jgi:ribose transport system permease protein
MQTIVRGMAYVYQVGADRRIDGTPFVDFINSYVAFIPTPVIIMLIVFATIWFLLRMTTFGRSVYAIGGNDETARLAGINVSRSIIVVYTMSAFLAGLAGIITAGRLSMGTAIVGTGAEMDAIAAVVVGGASLNGGKGSAVKALVGALIIAYLANLMNLLGVPPYPQMIIKGVIILMAVLINRSKN